MTRDIDPDALRWTLALDNGHAEELSFKPEEAFQRLAVLGFAEVGRGMLTRSQREVRCLALEWR